MSAYFRDHNSYLGFIRLAALTLLCTAGLVAGAQEQPSPRWEIFGGYSALDPGTAVHGILPGGVIPSARCLCWDTRGLGASLTYDFARWFGLTADMSGDWGSHETSPFERLDHAAFYNISGGPKFTYRTHHVSPFAEILAGGHRLTPELFHPDDEFGFMAGGGIDVNITRHFAFRLIRADYVYSNHQFGSSPAVPPTDLRGVRLQSGVVFMFGGGPAVIAHTVVAPPAPPPPPPVAPVTPVIDPPTVTCSANPAEVNPGESSSITANATSPQNRPLTYSYSSTAGSISGTSPTTTLSTAGAASGVITVTCSVEDDKGNMSSQTAQVMVAAPAVAAKPATTPLCSVTFDRDDRRPARVDNEAKACLDDIALNLQRSADATLGVIGNSAAQGGSNKLAAQRAVNTKAYLVTEKGIDPTRIATYTGTQNANLVSTTLIPPGATLDTTGDTAVDENQFKASSHAAGHGSRVLSH